MSEVADMLADVFEITRINKPLLDAHRGLVDGLQAMIVDGRLAESDIPDDYQWLQEALFNITGLVFCETCMTYDCQCAVCTECGEDNRFGEGYDGKCGSCADAAEIANELETQP